MLDTNGWRDSRRPGYVGGNKANAVRQLTERYGKGRWRIVWAWREGYIDRDEAIRHYEDAYVHFLDANNETLEWLLTNASDVYDISPRDVQSGLNYAIQQEKATHLQDIAIRRAVMRLGKEFVGDRLIQVRHLRGEGQRYNPGLVPFHMPELIVKPHLPGWWNEASIEDFYQSNKRLQIRDRN